MKKLVAKFGRYNVAAFVIMAVGAVLFLLTPFMLWLFNLDTDIIGVLIFLIGLIMWGAGWIVRTLYRFIMRNIESKNK